MELGLSNKNLNDTDSFLIKKKKRAKIIERDTSKKGSINQFEINHEIKNEEENENDLLEIIEDPKILQKKKLNSHRIFNPQQKLELNINNNHLPHQKKTSTHNKKIEKNADLSTRENKIMNDNFNLCDFIAKKNDEGNILTIDGFKQKKHKKIIENEDDHHVTPQNENLKDSKIPEENLASDMKIKNVLQLFLTNNMNAEKNCLNNSLEFGASFNSLTNHYEDKNKFLYKQIKFEFEESLHSMINFLFCKETLKAEDDQISDERIDITTNSNISVITKAEKPIPKVLYIEPTFLPKVLKIWDFMIKFKKYLEIEFLSLDRVQEILSMNSEMKQFIIIISSLLKFFVKEITNNRVNSGLSIDLMVIQFSQDFNINEEEYFKYCWKEILHILSKTEYFKQKHPKTDKIITNLIENEDILIEYSEKIIIIENLIDNILDLQCFRQIINEEQKFFIDLKNEKIQIKNELQNLNKNFPRSMKVKEIEGLEQRKARISTKLKEIKIFDQNFIGEDKDSNHYYFFKDYSSKIFVSRVIEKELETRAYSTENEIINLINCLDVESKKELKLKNKIKRIFEKSMILFDHKEFNFEDHVLENLLCFDYSVENESYLSVILKKIIENGKELSLLTGSNYSYREIEFIEFNEKITKTICLKKKLQNLKIIISEMFSHLLNLNKSKDNGVLANFINVYFNHIERFGQLFQLIFIFEGLLHRFKK